jgi:hypothetical protein
MFKALWILKIIYTEIRGDVKFKNRNRNAKKQYGRRLACPKEG